MSGRGFADFIPMKNLLRIFSVLLIKKVWDNTERKDTGTQPSDRAVNLI